MESFKQFKDKKGAPADDGKAAASTGENPTDGKKKDAQASGKTDKQAGKKNQDKIVLNPPDTPLTPNNNEPSSGPGSVSIVFQKESAPPGAKYERMVKHIKKSMASGGLTKAEKSKAYAIAWSQYNKVHEEAGSKTAVMAFGRFNPPTTGHDKLVDKVAAVAKEHKGSAHVFASHTEDNDKNPIPQKHKLNYMKKAFGDRAEIHGSSKAEPTFMHAAAKLHKAGHEHLVMVAGSDRVKEYQDRLNKYNGKFNDKGEGYHFKSIKVISAGERDPNAKGTEGMSGTKMREHARAGNHEEFKKGLPKALHPHAKEMMDKIRNAKSMKEEVESLLEYIAEKVVVPHPDPKQDSKAVVHIHDVKNGADFHSKWDKESHEHHAHFGHDSPILPRGERGGRKTIKMSYADWAKQVGHHASLKESLDEAVLTIQQRIKRGQQLRRMKAKLKLGKRMSRIRMKNPKQIERTTRKMARASMKWRVAGNRGAHYQELSPSNKIQVDKMVDKRVKAIKRIAARLKPRVKAAEVRRLQAIRSGRGAKSIKQFMAGNINAM